MGNPIKTLLIILAISLWIIVIRDIIKRRLKYLSFNLIWLMVVIFFPILGSILYLLLRKGMSAERPKKFDPKL